MGILVLVLVRVLVQVLVLVLGPVQVQVQVQAWEQAQEISRHLDQSTIAPSDCAVSRVLGPPGLLLHWLGHARSGSAVVPPQTVGC